MSDSITQPRIPQHERVSLLIDPDAVIAHLRFIDANGYHQLSAIHPLRKGNIVSRTFGPLAESELNIRKWVAQFGSEYGLYYLVNEPRRDLGANRAKKQDIASIRAVWVDLDPKDDAVRGQGLDHERQRLRGIVDNVRDDPDHYPSSVIDSGGGFQVLWRLETKLPARDAQALAEDQTRGITAAFGGDTSTCDVSRLLRLPGTINHPSEKKMRVGRTAPTQTRALFYDDGGDTTLDQLADFRPPLAQLKTKRQNVQQANVEQDLLTAVADEDDLPGDLRSRFADFLDGSDSARRLWGGDRGAVPGGDSSGSGFAFALALVLRPTGKFTATEYGMLLRVWEHSSVDKDKIDARYVARAWAKAPPAASEEFTAAEAKDLRSDPSAPLLGAWQPPADLWEREHAPADLQPGVVPDYVDRFSRDRARRLGVDHGAMAAATVTTLGSLVPAANNLHMRQHSNSWPVKSVPWTMIVGDPGTAKSPAVSAAMAFPRAVERAWREEYAKRKAEFDASQPPVDDGRRNRHRKKAAQDPAVTNPTTPATAEANTAEPSTLPADPFACTVGALPLTEPTLRRKIANDATTEALGTILANCPDAAPVLLHSDEIAGLIGSFDMYRSRGGRDRQFFLEAKEGAPFAIDRKSSGTTSVESLAIAILGTVQDDKLSQMKSLSDDGFQQRFAAVNIRKTGRGEDIPDDEKLDASIPRVALALADLEPKDYRLSPEADGELTAIQNFAEAECARFDLPTSLKTWLSKTPNEFGRYCLAFHLIEWASSAAPALDVDPEPHVSRATAVRARRYIQEFLYGHVGYVNKVIMAKGQDDGDVQWVAGYILTRELASINAREIGRAYRSLRGAQNRGKLMAVMATLTLQDWVKVTNETRGEWKVNPAVHDGRFSAIKRAETARRSAIKGEIAATAESRRSPSGVVA